MPYRRYPSGPDLAGSEAVVDQFEKSPGRVQLYHGDLEKLVAWAMDQIYDLSLTGTNNDRKMRLVALENPDRLVPERHREANAIEARP